MLFCSLYFIAIFVFQYQFFFSFCLATFLFIAHFSVLQTLEDELSHLRVEVQKQAEYLRLAEAEQNNQQREIQRLERSLNEKQEILL